MRFKDRAKAKAEAAKKLKAEPKPAPETPKVDPEATSVPEPEPERIITDQDLREAFIAWSTDCLCGLKPQLHAEKKGGNWAFYKSCPNCKMKSTTLYKAVPTVEQFLESYFGKWFRKAFKSGASS